ncbi:MAG: protein kinase [Gemmatimonadales bacterium]|nr:protein kinase [Gemmatimonadales bacterium]
MFCSRCGSEISGKSKFCPSCGLDLMATTPVHGMATGQIQESDLVREALSTEYEILEELGRGGMALVYRARDRHLEREVAIKVLPFSLAFDSEFVERFQREARTSAQLEHPNIIPIYRVGRSGRVIYFVMKYLRGGSVSDILAERGKLAPPEIRRLLIEAGSALGYAAQRGIVHRDIKPDNIMFDEFGQCLLTDFGIAKAASGQRLTGTGMSIGTPHYMSPEQARAQGIDGRSDIYSLGVVAYQCLTGTVPYDGEDSFSIGYKHITEPLPAPALVTADERRLFEVIKRTTMKDPAERYQSCEELVAALQGQPTAAPGALRSTTGATVSVAGVVSPSAALGAMAQGSYNMPTIVSRPTAPIDSPLVNRRATPRERREQPRRVADRSVAMRRGSGSFGWIWLVLAVLGGLGGVFYYYKSHGFAPGQPDAVAAGTARTGARAQAPVTVPAPPATPVRDDSSTAHGSAPVDSALDTTVAATADSTRPDSPSPIDSSTGPVPTGAGTSTRRDDSTTPVPAPPTRVVASRPAPTRPGMRRSVNRCEPGPGYNADGSCFEERPKPVNPPYVPVPADVVGTPRPSLLWIKVSAEGRTVDVQRLRPSNDPAFERDVRGFVWTVAWHPALRDGAPVEAWTQMLFPPAPRE